MKLERRCAICARRGVRRFHLMVSARTDDGRRTTRGAGRIDLCQDCWREVNAMAAPIRRPRSRRPT